MKNYFRILLGEKNVYAEEAHKGNFVGTGWFEDVDLTKKLPEEYRSFNKMMIPIYLKEHPDKTKISAGLACGMLWTVAKFLRIGDIVLCPDGKGSYYVGEITSNYHYSKDTHLPHRRTVQWYPRMIEFSQMSQSLQHSARSIGTVCDITKYSMEIEGLISGSREPTIVATDETIEEPFEFAMEEHLEEYLIKNWPKMLLGKSHDIYEEEGELVGQQYPSDTGSIDILAISKDKKELLVVELKRGRASDVVVGQIQRYMGYVKDELAEEGQTVRGVIIAHEDDPRIRRALSVAQGIDFYTYQSSFKLQKVM